MAKSLFYKSIVVFLAIALTYTHTFSNVEVVKAERNVQLNGLVTSQIVKVQHKCQAEDCGEFLFFALISEDFERVSHISFSKEKQNAESFKYTTQDYSQVKYSPTQKQGKYVLYKINIKTRLHQQQTFVLTATITYLNRFINYPKSIDLSEDQKFQYEDNKQFLSPYTVKESVAHYKFIKLIGYEQDGEKKGLSTVTFRSQDISPFSYVKHRVHGVNNEPQVYFSEVIREIEVSHWGNIAITEFYKIKNVGPELKGQFSRVQFGSNNKFEAKNAWRGIQTDLPYQIRGLYYRDQVGNISTSRAYRSEKNAVVRVGFAPRYALLGGWKANWEIGYNLNTQGFLKHDGHNFELSKIPIEYGLSTILAEKYTIKLILPEGASNVKLSLGSQALNMDKIVKGVSFGYLDFAGRPTFTVQDLKGTFKDQKLKVAYEFDNSSLFRKPLTVFVAIFSILSLLIVVKRLNMSAFEEHHAKKIN